MKAYIEMRTMYFYSKKKQKSSDPAEWKYKVTGCGVLLPICAFNKKRKIPTALSGRRLRIIDGGKIFNFVSKPPQSKILKYYIGLLYFNKYLVVFTIIL